MAYTVKQLSDLAGVSPRTLRHYDAIGLLKPASCGENGYRYYSNESLLRLQQILFYRELDFSLEEIKEIVGSPDFDVIAALRAHKKAMRQQRSRLERLIVTIDKTILHLEGKRNMSHKEYFENFSEEKQRKYAEEIRQRFGDKAFEGCTDWSSYTPEQQAAIRAEIESIYRDFVEKIDHDPRSAEVQQIVARWHQNLRYFYEPSVEGMRGLGQFYSEHPDFAAKFRSMHPTLPEFLLEAIDEYCGNLTGAV
ncbi:MAG: MerR family transcriptional regulator [Candidatus Hydrogenedentes bacterium]|nr:MerR family transcriptional regulator [Candidatus Hydrogenedentota bacterium]